MAGICTGTLNVCVPAWQCEPGQTGYETDGCGNRRANPSCLSLPTGGGDAGKGGMIVLALLGLGVLGAVVYASRETKPEYTEYKRG